MKRSKIPTMVIKRIFQEAASCCAFCTESDVAALEIHHLNDDPKNNAQENLLLVCSSCHSKITHDVIPPADAYLKKKIVQSQARTNIAHIKQPMQQSVNVSHTQNSGIIANIVNIKGRKSPRVNYPLNSIGADIIKKSYVDYLYGQYLKFRKADTSFGAYDHAKRFHPGELHHTIRAKFKAQTFFIHMTRFDELVSYIQGRIDKTILGRRNRSQNTPNYDLYEVFRLEQLGHSD